MSEAIGENIKPTINKLNEMYSYNPNTGALTYKVKRHLCEIGDEVGYISVHGGIKYRRMRLCGQMVNVHQVILAMINGEYPSCTDHIDGDGLNNKAENLRAVPMSVNMKNKKMYEKNKTGLPGVEINKGGRFGVRITANKERMWLGTYTERWDAFCAKKSAEYKYGFCCNHGRC